MRNNSKTLACKIILLTWSLLFAASANAQDLIKLDQGWDAQDQAKAHHMDGGAEVMPARWFFALELHSTPQKLTTQLANFGFLQVDGGLPVGVMISEDAITESLYGEKKWLGVNCTACHTSVLNVNGNKVLIDGNQSLFRIQEFEASIIDSVSATLADSGKFDRFAKELGAENKWDRLKLKYHLKLFREEFGNVNQLSRHFRGRNGQEIPYGPGRIDGIGSAANALTCYLTARLGGNPLFAGFVTDSDNCRMSHPPTSIPHLWGMTHMQFSQWNVDVHSSLGRNVGAMMSGYGKNWVEMDLKGNLKFKTTVNIENIYKFEELYKKLKTPRWQELAEKGVVAPLNEDQVVRGQQVYNAKCIQCHQVQSESTAPNKFGNAYWKIPTIPASEVGTEENYLLADNKRRAKVPYFLTKVFKQTFGDKVIAEDGTVPSALYRGVVAGGTIKHYFEENKTSVEKMLLMTNCRESAVPQKVLGLKARSLEGIVWTAPYLHNGSVPNLLELLTPAAKRVKTFYVGCNKYDAQAGGFACDANSENVFLFDTSLEGNHNAGHEYGTELEMAQKLDLIEYSKSLEQPQNPSPQNPDCH